MRERTALSRKEKIQPHCRALSRKTEWPTFPIKLALFNQRGGQTIRPKPSILPIVSQE
jgi:hypothetical protein